MQSTRLSRPSNNEIKTRILDVQNRSSSRIDPLPAINAHSVINHYMSQIEANKVNRKFEKALIALLFGAGFGLLVLTGLYLLASNIQPPAITYTMDAQHYSNPSK